MADIYLGLPVLDRSEVAYRRAPAADEPLVVRRPLMREFQEVRYWTPDADTNGEPDGTLAADAIGRTPRIPGGAGRYAFPPTGGWPALAAAGGVYVRFLVGFSEAHPHADLLRDAGVAYIRAVLNGAKLLEPNAAMLALLRPLRDSLNGEELVGPGGWDDAVPYEPDDVLTFGGTPVTVGGRRIGFDG